MSYPPKRPKVPTSKINRSETKTTQRNKQKRKASLPTNAMTISPSRGRELRSISVASADAAATLARLNIHSPTARSRGRKSAPIVASPVGASGLVHVPTVGDHLPPIDSNFGKKLTMLAPDSKIHMTEKTLGEQDNAKLEETIAQHIAEADASLHLTPLQPSSSSVSRKVPATPHEDIQERPVHSNNEETSPLSKTPDFCISPVCPSATKKLLRKLSSFTLKASALEKDEDGPGTSESNTVLKSSSPEKKKKTDQIERSDHPEHKTKMLLRKLSSYTLSQSTSEEENSSQKNSPQKVTLASNMTSAENHSSKMSMFKNLRQRTFVGNPTSSFLEEEAITAPTRPKSSNGKLKKCVVRYFFQERERKNMQRHLKHLEKQKEEAAIRQLVRDQEDAEEKETIERIIAENNSKNSRMLSEWRNASMFTSAVAKFKKNKKKSDIKQPLETGNKELIARDVDDDDDDIKDDEDGRSTKDTTDLQEKLRKERDDAYDAYNSQS